MKMNANQNKRFEIHTQRPVNMIMLDHWTKSKLIMSIDSIAFLRASSQRKRLQFGLCVLFCCHCAVIVRAYLSTLCTARVSHVPWFLIQFIRHFRSLRSDFSLVRRYSIVCACFTASLLHCKSSRRTDFTSIGCKMTNCSNKCTSNWQWESSESIFDWANCADLRWLLYHFAH